MAKGGPMVERVCRQCATTFPVLARRARRKNRAQFCSRSCQGRSAYERHWAHVERTGATNPNWKGGISRNHYHYKRLFEARHPEKARAARMARAAVRSGRLVRPAACQDCGATCKPAGHHDDYTKPLSVRWLCKTCHVAADRERQARETSPSALPPLPLEPESGAIAVVGMSSVSGLCLVGIDPAGDGDGQFLAFHAQPADRMVDAEQALCVSEQIEREQ